MDNLIYWLWLQSALGFKAPIGPAIGYFGGAKEIYEAGAKQRALSGTFTPAQCSAMQLCTQESAEQILENCEKNGTGILTPESSAYPVLLKDLRDLPAVLYFKGDPSFLNEGVNVAMVGTRMPSVSSADVARRFGSEISASGISVISGVARGIDTCAHMGALDAGASTCAVLGCGFCVNYLKENEQMRRMISETGVLLTEYPPGTRAGKFTFPARNRIISGISLGVLIIEAGVKSGSLITAKYALAQGRDVFAVPGDIVNSDYAGANSLIRDGAKPVFCSDDVIDEYAAVYPQYVRKRSEKREPLSTVRHTVKRTPGPKLPVKRPAGDELSDSARETYGVFNEDEIHISEIALKTGLSMNILLGALTELEMFGYIQLKQGRKYSVK